MYRGPRTYYRRRKASPNDIEQGTFRRTIHTVCWRFFVRTDTWRIRRLHNMVGEKEQQQEASMAEHIGMQKGGYVAWFLSCFPLSTNKYAFITRSLCPCCLCPSEGLIRLHGQRYAHI